MTNLILLQTATGTTAECPEIVGNWPSLPLSHLLNLEKLADGKLFQSNDTWFIVIINKYKSNYIKKTFQKLMFGQSGNITKQITTYTTFTKDAAGHEYDVDMLYSS